MQQKLKKIDVSWILNLEFTRILSASQPAVRLGCTRCIAPEFLHNKGNHVGLTKLLFQSTYVYPLCHGASFCPLLVSFRLQIAYRNLLIGVDKLPKQLLFMSIVRIIIKSVIIQQCIAMVEAMKIVLVEAMKIVLVERCEINGQARPMYSYIVYFIVNDPLMQPHYYAQDDLEFTNIIALFTCAQELCVNRMKFQRILCSSFSLLLPFYSFLYCATLAIKTVIIIL